MRNELQTQKSLQPFFSKVTGSGRSCLFSAFCAAVLLVMALLLSSTTALHAQTSAIITGTVYDANGNVVAKASVNLRDEATGEKRDTVTNNDGVFAFPALNPDTYDVKIQAKGFKTLTQTGIVLNAAESRKLLGLNLSVGGVQETVTVEESNQVIPTDNGSRAALLDNNDIENLSLGSRDLSELLKVLPGVTTTPNGTGAAPNFSFTNVGAAGSAVGNGLNANGLPSRGGTYQLADGVDVDDPGCNCNSIATINPDMTAEVSVQTSNFGADAPFGPGVINAISKSGGAEYHGEGYFYARNDALDAFDWQTLHNWYSKTPTPTTGPPTGSAKYYYPGGNIGGPVPFTKKKLEVWGGFERIIQNLGNSSNNTLKSVIPTSDQMQGNFGPTALNQTFCSPLNVDPNNWGYALVTGKPDAAINGNGCNNIGGITLSDGTVVASTGPTADIIPTKYLDPGAKALASFWPAANSNPATTSGNYNYVQVVPAVRDGWTYRIRGDYHFSDNTSAFVSYQQGYDASPSSGAGAHIYWTPGNSIPYPGGCLLSKEYTKALSGHFTHTFNATTTDEFIASWGYGNFPVGPSVAGGNYRTTLGYPTPSANGYNTVFNTGSKLIPSYSSGGAYTFPDFSQADIFENSTGTYLVRKEMPAFSDNLTKVWGKHTVKVGGFMENTGNIQGASGSANGSLNSFSFGGTPAANLVTGTIYGAPNNPLANFVQGIVTGYSENNSAPNGDMKFQTFAGYVDDSFKASHKLTLELGIRFTHLGHWYDHNQLGMADFFPTLVQSDYAIGKFDPGAYWHGINPGVPNSGQPDRFASLDPRFGLAYDVFGTGKTVVRGGFGLYRFADQYNDYAGALTTAQSVLSYGLPSNSFVTLQQIGNPEMVKPSTTCGAGCVNGGYWADTPGDYKNPYTETWNLTISQQLRWNSLMEIAYVGNNSQDLVPGGQSISGSGFSDYVNVNKVPMGAFFNPDPKTGVTAVNPEDPTHNTDGSSNGNKTADYRPYGTEYGDNSVYVENNDGYANYHALQVTWVKRSKDLNFNANYTWSKSLGTALTVDPFHIRGNYGAENIDRPHVVNLSASYTFEHPFSSKLVSTALGGWSISNYTTWQDGGNLQADNSPNFGMGLQYTTINGLPIQDDPTKPNLNPLPHGPLNNAMTAYTYVVGNGVGGASYYGTNASIDVMPISTCSKLVYTCFAAPAFKPYTSIAGGQSMPYFHGPIYFDSDLSLYKTFPVRGKQNVEFKLQAFNWLNHPLNQYSGGNRVNVHYGLEYTTKAISVDSGSYPTSNPAVFGVYDQKSGAPTQRILEVSAKYNF